MATYNELRLQKLLSPLNNQGTNNGIMGIDQDLPLEDPFTNSISSQANSIKELANSISSEDLPLIDPFVGYDMKMNNQFDPRNFQSIFPTSGIIKQAPTQNYQFQTSAYEDQGGDVEQEFLPDQKSSLKDSLSSMGRNFGISSLLSMVTDNPIFNLLRNNLPKQDPRATGIQDFYSPEGLTSTGSVASGIMQGYNPVSGGFLNMITGGKFGEPTQYGLSGAMQRRIENIIGRRAPQTSSSRSKISKLRNLQRQEMQDRSDRGESLGSIGKSTFSGPGMAFEKQNSGTGKGPR
jgi:hypothetical protein